MKRYTPLLLMCALCLVGCELTVANPGQDDARLSSEPPVPDAHLRDGHVLLPPPPPPTDARVPPPVDAQVPPPIDACEGLCRAFADCAAGPHLCPQLTPDDHPHLFEGCMDDCVAAGAQPEPMASCEGLIGVVSEWDPAIADACAPPIPMETCVALCGELSLCALDADLCPGFEGEAREAIEGGCVEACFDAGLPNGTPYPHECDALVGFASEMDPGFDALCRGGEEPPPVEGCEASCDALMGCLADPDLCPGASGAAPEGVRWMCLEQCEAMGGRLPSMGSCEETLPLLFSLDPGLERLCVEGPPPPDELCDPLCGRLAECASDPDLCPGAGGLEGAVMDACFAQCEASGVPFSAPPEFIECDALVGITSEFNLEFAEICYGDVEPPPPEIDTCAAACDRALECVWEIEGCPDADMEGIWGRCMESCDPFEGSLEALFPDSCDGVVFFLQQVDPIFVEQCWAGDPPPIEEPPIETCEHACAFAADCAFEPEICPGFEGQDPGLFFEACFEACAPFEGSLHLFAYESCEALVDLATSLDPALAELCGDEEAPPPEADCPLACDYLLGCAVEEIPACREADPDLLFEECMEMCAPNEGLIAPVFEQECRPLLDMLEQLGVSAEAICQGAQPPDAPRACIEGCDSLAECALEAGRCPDGDPSPIFDACIDACAEMPDLGDVFLSQECPGLLQTVEMMAPDMLARCDEPVDPPSICPEACERLAFCAVEAGPCGAAEAEIFDYCVARCEEIPGLMDETLEMRCRPLVASFLDLDPGFAEVCEGGAPPAGLQSCEHACQLSVECASEICPDAVEGRRALFNRCVEGCQPIAPLIVGQEPEGCAQMVDLLRMIDPEFADACEPAPEVELSCEEVCAGAIDCAHDPRLCPGFEGVDLEPFLDNCLLRCEAQGGGLSSAAEPTCGALIELASSVDPVFGEICGYEGGGPEPDQQQCFEACEYIIGCIEGECQVDPSLREELWTSCRMGCDQGEGPPPEIFQFECVDLVNQLAEGEPFFAEICGR